MGVYSFNKGLVKKDMNFDYFKLYIYSFMIGVSIQLFKLWFKK